MSFEERQLNTCRYTKEQSLLSRPIIVLEHLLCQFYNITVTMLIAQIDGLHMEKSGRVYYTCSFSCK